MRQTIAFLSRLPRASFDPTKFKSLCAQLRLGHSFGNRMSNEATLSRRSAVLDAITYAAKGIIGAADWQPAMPELLTRLGNATEASRAFLFEIHPATGGVGPAQSCRFLWSAPDVYPLSSDHPRLQNVSIPTTGNSQLAELFARRSRGEVIQITRRQTRGDARELFDETKTLSLLSVPIMV